MNVLFIKPILIIKILFQCLASSLAAGIFLENPQMHFPAVHNPRYLADCLNLIIKRVQVSSYQDQKKIEKNLKYFQF